VLAWEQSCDVPLLIWQTAPGVRVAFSTRTGGISVGSYRSLNLGFRSGDQAGNVAENRRRLCRAIGADPARTSSCHQQHSATVHHVDADPPRAFDDPDLESPAGDGLVTSRPGRAIVAFGADCVTVAAARTDGSAVAVCHAGWRGLLAGIVEHTITKLGGACVAAVGPCAGPERYEVRDDVAAPLRARFGAGVLRGRFVDLARCTEIALADAGATGIETAAMCTISDEHRFFSYRRDGAACGRQAVIALLDHPR
jgi:polyphenol oxidase